MEIRTGLSSAVNLVEKDMIDIKPTKRSNLFRGSRGAAATRRKPRVFGNVEALEERALLSLTLQTHAIPETSGLAVQDLVYGQDGNLWFSEVPDVIYFGGPGPLSGAVRRMTPAGAVTIFPLPTNDGVGSITAGPDGNIWMIEQTQIKVTPTKYPAFIDDYYSVTSSLVRITPQGVFTSFALPSSLKGDPSLVSGPDGNLWAVEGGTVAKITTSGNVTIVVSASASTTDNFDSPVFGPDGNLWVGNGSSSASEIDRITPQGAITRFPLLVELPTSFPTSAPFDLVDGPDGNIWYVVNSTQSSIGKISTSGVVVGSYLAPTGLTFTSITASPANNSVWFAGYTNSVIPTPLQIGRITSGGQITVNSAQSLDTGGGAITFGPGGNLWYVEATSASSSNVPITQAIGEADFTPLAATASQSGTHISLAFIGPVDTATAENVDNYSLKLVLATRRGVFDIAPAAIKAVQYNAATDTVSFQFTRRFAPYLQKFSAYLHYQITVNGQGTTGLATTDGQHLSGAGTGHPGTNLSALVARMTRLHAARFRHR